MYDIFYIHVNFFFDIFLFFIFHGSHPGSHDSHGSHSDSHDSLARTLGRPSDDVGHVDLQLDEKAVALSEVNSQRLKKLSGRSETLHTILY